MEQHGDQLLRLPGCNPQKFDACKGVGSSKSVFFRRTFHTGPKHVPSMHPSLCLPHIQTRIVVILGRHEDTLTLVLFPCCVGEVLLRAFFPTAIKLPILQKKLICQPGQPCPTTSRERFPTLCSSYSSASKGVSRTKTTTPQWKVKIPRHPKDRAHFTDRLFAFTLLTSPLFSLNSSPSVQTSRSLSQSGLFAQSYFTTTACY